MNKCLKEWKNEYKPETADVIGFEALDIFSFITRRLAGVTGQNRWHSDGAKNLEWAIDNYRYRHALLKRYRDEMESKVIQPALDKGYDVHDVSTMLLFRNLAESPQRKNIISSLGLREIDADLAKKLGERTASEVFEYLSKQQPDLVKLTDAFYEVRQRMVIPRIKESRMYDQELMSVLENNINM